MSTLQVQARALGDPTRHEIFRFVRDAGAPVGVAELTDHLGLNHNAVRQHLAKLVAAGLLTERTAAAAGRGRPRLLYALDPRGDGRWSDGGPYERLALLLVEALRSGEPPEVVGRRAGRRQWGQAPDPDDPVGALVDRMEQMGFDPTVRRKGGRADIVLHNCPFATAAAADADTVCGLHLGLARGLAEGAGGLTVDELVPKDPRRAGCQLRCHVEAPTG